MGANQNECYSIHFIPEESAETFLLEHVGHFVCMLAIVHFGTTGAILSSAWVCATQYLGVGEVGSVDWCFVVVGGDGCEPISSCKRHMERLGHPLNLHFKESENRGSLVAANSQLLPFRRRHHCPSLDHGSRRDRFETVILNATSGTTAQYLYDPIRIRG
jgi:hypothetical protein